MFFSSPLQVATPRGTDAQMKWNIFGYDDYPPGLRVTTNQQRIEVHYQGRQSTSDLCTFTGGESTSDLCTFAGGESTSDLCTFAGESRLLICAHLQGRVDF